MKNFLLNESQSQVLINLLQEMATNCLNAATMLKNLQVAPETPPATPDEK